MAGTRVLSQVISASSCERNWSAHWHIPLKIRNRLEPATTEKLACVYSNSKMLAATHDAVELKKLACDNEDANIAAVWLRVTLRHTPLRAGHGPDVARVAESTSRESRLRDAARLGQPGRRSRASPAAQTSRRGSDIKKGRGHDDCSVTGLQSSAAIGSLPDVVGPLTIRAAAAPRQETLRKACPDSRPIVRARSAIRQPLRANTGGGITLTLDWQRQRTLA